MRSFGLSSQRSAIRIIFRRVSPCGWLCHPRSAAWGGQQVRQYVDGMRANAVPVTAAGGWSIYKWGWQFSGSQALDEAYVPCFGAFGAAWDDAMVARWSADSLALFWLEMRRSSHRLAATAVRREWRSGGW